jgi:hypothetical protein
MFLSIDRFIVGLLFVASNGHIKQRLIVEYRAAISPY